MLGPLDSTPYRELAKLYAEAGFFESALVEKDRALALDPSNLAALNLKIFLRRIGMDIVSEKEGYRLIVPPRFLFIERLPH